VPAHIPLSLSVSLSYAYCRREILPLEPNWQKSPWLLARNHHGA